MNPDDLIEELSDDPQKLETFQLKLEAARVRRAQAESAPQAETEPQQPTSTYEWTDPRLREMHEKLQGRDPNVNMHLFLTTLDGVMHRINATATETKQHSHDHVIRVVASLEQELHGLLDLLNARFDKLQAKP